MCIIGLTGGIASGKSLVSTMLQKLGAVVIDADRIARDMVEPGRPALMLIVRKFGQDVLNPDGSLNREALSQIVFSDPKKLNKLNQITHPFIIKEIKRLLKKYQRIYSEKVIVVDAPLLLEVGLERMVNEVWVVYVDFLTQLKRLMKRDDLTEEKAYQRIRAQTPLEEKVKKAARVIDNRGTPKETEAQVKRIWHEITKSPNKV